MDNVDTDDSVDSDDDDDDDVCSRNSARSPYVDVDEELLYSRWVDVGIGIIDSSQLNSAGGYIDLVHTSWRIHSKADETREYTPGKSGCAQPTPQLTTPTQTSSDPWTSLPLITGGPELMMDLR